MDSGGREHDNERPPQIRRLDSERAHRLLELALDVSRTNGAVADEDLEHTWVYDATGAVQPEEILGLSDSDLFGEGSDLPTTDLKRDAIDAGERVVRTFAFDKPDGRKWFRAAAQPAVDADGTIEGVLFAATDLSERYRLLDRTTDGLYTVDDEWTITYWNDQMEYRTGVTADEVLGEHLFETFGEAIPLELEERYRRAMRTGATVEFEQYIGDPFDYRVEVRVFPDDHGLSIYSRDVTERHQRERHLRRHSHLFDRVQEMADVGIWEYDFDSGELYWSDGMKSLHGVASEDDLIVNDVFEFYHPEDRDRLVELFEWASGDDDPVEDRLRIVGDAGEVTHVRVYGEVVTDDDGTPALARGTVHDVTDQVARERALTELQRRTAELSRTDSPRAAAQLVAEAVEDLVGVALAGLHLLSNDGQALEATAGIGTARESGDGLPSYDRDAVDDPAAATVWSTFTDGEPRYIPDVAAIEGLADQTTVDSCVIHPLGGHGVFVTSAREPDAFDSIDRTLLALLARALHAALDRLERDRRLRQKNERLDQFASVVSHDLRNPLSVATGWLEIARDTGDPEAFARVERAHDRMEALVSDLLSLAREGQSIERSKPVDLGELVTDVWSLVATDDAMLNLEADNVIFADEQRLRQLFENLFRNAVEHAGPTVTVTVGDLQRGFYVADDGPGIDLEDRDQVFEHGYSTADEGTGYGLAIVAGIAEAHDWHVVVTEADIGGARFEFTSIDVVE